MKEELPLKLRSGDFFSLMSEGRLASHDLKYNNSFFAFIDILGFRSRLDELGENAPSFFYELLWDQLQLAKSMYQSVQVKMLSDSLLIWTEESLPIDFWNLLNVVAIVKDTLFKKGILVRGGISVGRNFISKDILVSPALVKAYQLEQTAHFPRILIDKEVYKKAVLEADFKTDSWGQCHIFMEGFARQVNPAMLTADFDGRFILSNFTDEPGVFFLRNSRPLNAIPENAPLDQKQVNQLLNSAKLELQNRKAVLENLLNTSQKTDVLEKLNYLGGSYNLWIESLGSEYSNYKVVIKPI